MGYYSMKDSQETKDLIRSIISEIRHDKELRLALRDALIDGKTHEDKRFCDDRDWSHHMIKPNGW